MNIALVVFFCYALAGVMVLGVPALIHRGVLATRKREYLPPPLQGRDWSLPLLVTLVLYIGVVTAVLCMGFFMLYIRFIK